MPLTLNGAGTIGGLTAGGLPDDCIVAADIASNAVTTAKINDAAVTTAKLAQPLTLATAQNSTSGTAINFTGIPNWVKRVSIMFDNVSISGNNYILVRLGTSSGYESTGYRSQMAITNTTSVSTNSTIGFIMHYPENASTSSGTMTLSHMGNNLWTSSGTYCWIGSTNSTIMSGGSKQLSGVLDRIQILAFNGTDTFDSGSINIMYEG